ncbi:MAG: hypothetical protein DI591_05330 [Citromicrobium sp.]|nr:MAG: hypothetical protein DI591_05330 [Citromicrobium sp.]
MTSAFALFLVEETLGDIAARTERYHRREAHAAEDGCCYDTQGRAGGAADSVGLTGDLVADICTDNLTNHV